MHVLRRHTNLSMQLTRVAHRGQTTSSTWTTPSTLKGTARRARTTSSICSPTAGTIANTRRGTAHRRAVLRTFGVENVTVADNLDDLPSTNPTQQEPCCGNLEFFFRTLFEHSESVEFRS